MNDDVFIGLMAVSFLLSLILVALLWWMAAKSVTTRRFWEMLAAAWTLNLLADIGWGVHEMVGGEGQPAWTNALYMGRYVLILLTFWLHPKAWPRRRWLEVLAAMVLAGLVLWLGLARPAAVRSQEPSWFILGRMGYPILDAGLLCAAWLRWRSVSAASLRQAMALITLGMLSYGVANWINFGVPLMPSPSAEIYLLLADLFWLLTTVFVGLAAWRFLRQKKARSSLRQQDRATK